MFIIKTSNLFHQKEEIIKGVIAFTLVKKVVQNCYTLTTSNSSSKSNKISVPSLTLILNNLNLARWLLLKTLISKFKLLLNM